MHRKRTDLSRGVKCRASGNVPGADGGREREGLGRLSHPFGFHLFIFRASLLPLRPPKLLPIPCSPLPLLLLSSLLSSATLLPFFSFSSPHQIVHFSYSPSSPLLSFSMSLHDLPFPPSVRYIDNPSFSFPSKHLSIPYSLPVYLTLSILFSVAASLFQSQ